MVSSRVRALGGRADKGELCVKSQEGPTGPSGLRNQVSSKGFGCVLVELHRLDTRGLIALPLIFCLVAGLLGRLVLVLGHGKSREVKGLLRATVSHYFGMGSPTAGPGRHAGSENFLHGICIDIPPTHSSLFKGAWEIHGARVRSRFLGSLSHQC